MRGKRLLFIPSLVKDRGDAVYPFIHFSVFGPIPPTACDTLKAIFPYVKPGVGTWIYRLGDRVVGKSIRWHSNTNLQLCWQSTGAGVNRYRGGFDQVG